MKNSKPRFMALKALSCEAGARASIDPLNNVLSIPENKPRSSKKSYFPLQKPPGLGVYEGRVQHFSSGSLARRRLIGPPSSPSLVLSRPRERAPRYVFLRPAVPSARLSATTVSPTSRVPSGGRQPYKNKPPPRINRQAVESSIDSQAVSIEP